MAVVLPLTVVVVDKVPTEVVAMAVVTATHLVLVASHPGGKLNENTRRLLLGGQFMEPSI